MKIFFLTPLVISIGAAAYMVFLSQAHLAWKIVVVLLVLIAATLQLLDWFVEPVSVHFLIPLMIQIVVGIAVYVHSSMDQISAGW